jgi:hypothetical protein
MSPWLYLSLGSVSLPELLLGTGLGILVAVAILGVVMFCSR